MKIIKKLIKYFWYHPIAERFPVLREMFKYALVGVSNTLIDFYIYFSLTRLFDFWREYYLAANLVAFSAAATWAFFLNKYWTFGHRGQGAHKQFIKFVSVCFFGLILAETILYLTVDVFHQSDVWGKILAIFIVYFWNFFTNKYWTFKRAEGEN